MVVYRSAGRTGPSIALSVEGSETLGSLFRRAAPSLEIDVEPAYSLKTPLMISTENGSWYSEGPDRWSRTMGSIANGASSIDLFVYPLVLCMHGSPGVLGRGHLCGWC